MLRDSIRPARLVGLRPSCLFSVDPFRLSDRLGCHVFKDYPIGLVASAFRYGQTIAGTVSETLCCVSHAAPADGRR